MVWFRKAKKSQDAKAHTGGVNGEPSSHITSTIEHDGNPTAFPAPPHDEHSGPSQDSSVIFSSLDTGSRSDNSDVSRDIKCELLASYIHAKQEERIWITGEPGEGVLVKKRKGEYAVCPASLISDGTSLYQSISALNVRVSYMNRLAVPD